MTAGDKSIQGSMVETIRAMLRARLLSAGFMSDQPVPHANLLPVATILGRRIVPAAPTP